MGGLTDVYLLNRLLQRFRSVAPVSAMTQPRIVGTAVVVVYKPYDERSQMNVAESSALERELAYFEQHRSELLGRAKGKFALIKHEELIDIFDSQFDAIRAGYRKFGNTPFLVKQIVAVDVPLNFTSLNIGV
jgi:hypothetical protein